RDADGYAGPGTVRGSRSPEQVTTAVAAGRGDNLSEMPGKGAGAALRQRGGPGRGPASVRDAGANYGAAGGEGGAVVAVVPAQQGGGRAPGCGAAVTARRLGGFDGGGVPVSSRTGQRA